MESGFRILAAKTRAVRQRYPWRPKELSAVLKSVEVSFTTEINQNSKNHVSVILGRNGQGKSRILSAIASAFQQIDENDNDKPMQSAVLSWIKYSIDGRENHIAFRSLARPLLLKGSQYSVDNQIFPMPNKVIALSMTPFDKFPLENHSRQLDLFEFRPEKKYIYSYIGMRDRAGRSSISALLFRAIEGLFSRKGAVAQARIAKVFALVGYEPSLDVVFRLNIEIILDIAKGGDLLLSKGVSYIYQGNRLNEWVANDPDARIKVRHACTEILKFTQDKTSIVSINVQSPSHSSLTMFSHFQLLRNVGLARLVAVEAQKFNGSLVDLKQASSGELSIAITFLSLASSLEDNSLVLIDEPETSLHPEWQSKYLDLLLETFSDYSGCHFILATHSPLILADAPLDATLASVSDDVPETGKEVAGRPTDYLLAKAFQTVTGSNLYVQQEVIKALRLAADGKINSEDFQKTVKELSELKSFIRDNPGIVEVISNLEIIANKKSADYAS